MRHICAGHAQQCFAQANDAVYGAAAWAIIQMQKTRKLSAGDKKVCMSQVIIIEMVGMVLYIGRMTQQSLLDGRYPTSFVSLDAGWQGSVVCSSKC